VGAPWEAFLCLGGPVRERAPNTHGRDVFCKENVASAAPAPTEEFTPQTISTTAHLNAMFNSKAESKRVGRVSDPPRPKQGSATM
jgi:hypothetical protein